MKVNGRKRQAAVDTLGLLWAVDVHAVHQADARMGCHLWPKLMPVSQRLEKVPIDASYQGAFTQVAAIWVLLPRLQPSLKLSKDLFLSSSDGSWKEHLPGVCTPRLISLGESSKITNTPKKVRKQLLGGIVHVKEYKMAKVQN